MPRFPAVSAPFARALLLAAPLLPAAGCGSTASSHAAETPAPARTRPIQIRFVDWRTNLNLVLVDQSHTDRAELYSSTRSLAEAGTKVATDEVLEETLKFFREQGFFDHAVPGPAQPGAGAIQSLEVETPDGAVHFDVGRGTPEAAGQVFRTCRLNFTALYNNVYQLQSVDKVPDWESQNESSQKKLGLTPKGGNRP